ncbi:MAG TPA: NAD(P)/FAD-dependent oxidoreductase [Burkholderiaceae bacterium]|jgi:cation diffusion facilitator CzcD-associated flavoprotein CzcO
MTVEHVDILIVGAGLSGIGAACHLARECPDRQVAILEGREDLGGTWSLFRYPGIRCDSDMYTLGYSFRPWSGKKAIADGPSILQYLRDTAREHGVDKLIRYGHQVRGAAWSSGDARWTLQVERGGETVQIRASFLVMCVGYYDYAAGYTPEFEGLAQFKGRLVHPQHWPDDVDYRGKRVVVIGSGATAVTLIPELAKQAAHVTMLQRSPTYMVVRPSVDPVATWLAARLPRGLAHRLTKTKNVLLGMYVFQIAKRRPQLLKTKLIDLVKARLGPDYDVGTHFTPRYNPWEQRLCLVPDGDLFKAVREQRASVVTDHIANFTETGIKLRSGAELAADVVVSATGLKLNLMNNLAIDVDGRRVEPGRLVSYKGVMFGGLPNFASVFGYTNASWTLKADLSSRYLCRVLKHMQRSGARQFVPHVADPSMAVKPWVDFSSGYFLRSADQLPKQGADKPWKLNQNYALDLMSMRFGSLDDGVLRFSA